MSIKLHKVIYCFDSLIILLYEHKFKNKILFNLTFIIISFMTHKNSILELILTDTNVLSEEHRYRTNAYRCTKKITRSM
jgi:hypothetical protein